MNGKLPMLEYLKSVGLKYPILGSSGHPRAYLDEFSKSKGSASLLLTLTYLAAASSGRNLSVCMGWQLSRNLQAAAWSSRVTAYRKGKKNRIGTQTEPGQQVSLQHCHTLQSLTSGFCSLLCKHQGKGIWNAKKNKTKALLPHPAPSCLPQKVSIKTR